MNQSLVVIVLANVLLLVDAVYYSYGVNGKACAEKYKDIATKQI